MKTNQHITKISAKQKDWADGLVYIGAAKKEGAPRSEIESRAKKVIDKLYDFKKNHILFKPTLASKEPFRFNYKETLSYFIGSDFIDEDKGFALTPWKKVIFHPLKPKNIIKQDCDLLVMGTYTFIDYRDEAVTVEYTFGYRGDHYRIFLHHSSLSYQPKPDLALALKEAAKREKGLSGFRVVLPGDFNYHQAKEISNSYFTYQPTAIAFPRSTSQVAFSIKEYRKNANQDKNPLRIMSGGHQHEGMSSAPNAYIIRLSELGDIMFNTHKTEAWIPSGMKLGMIYQELAFYHKMIPGGGCLNVNVGGLTQGGGWGMYSREFGLTCDNILAAEVVLANGDIVQASPVSHKDLFYAIRGGGGGNFGVVTRFLFKLQEIQPIYYRFNFCWKQNQMEAVIAKWLEIQKDFPQQLTSYLRLTAMTEDMIDKKHETYPVYASGTFSGNLLEFLLFAVVLRELPQPDTYSFSYKKAANWVPFFTSEDKTLKSKSAREKQLQQEFTNSVPAAIQEIRPYLDSIIKNKNQTDLLNLQELENMDLDMVTPSDSIPNTLESIINLFSYDNVTSTEGVTIQNDGMNHSKVASPKVNCNAPHPHKVSSAFSNNTGTDYYQNIAKVVSKYFEDSLKNRPENYFKFVRSYLTFHAMGGAITKEPIGGSAFAFRDTEFLIQIQSWWNYPNGTVPTTADRNWQQPYIDWVTQFRATLQKKKLVNGGFINFVDREIPLEEYYGKNFKKLQAIKKTYDPENLFRFPMSISPTSK